MEENESSLRQRWLDFLAEEGYRPHLEINDEQPERARLAFKVEGLRYTLYLDEGDPTFFNLVLCYRLGDLTDEPEVLLAAANALTRQTKGTKVWVDQEDRSANFNYEWFAEDVPSSRLFERLISQCRYAVDGFFEKAREMAKPVETV
jgi:hypothetical protein